LTVGGLFSRLGFRKSGLQETVWVERDVRGIRGDREPSRELRLVG
jgi:hypothetical protein